MPRETVTVYVLVFYLKLNNDYANYVQWITEIKMLSLHVYILDSFCQDVYHNDVLLNTKPVGLGKRHYQQRQMLAGRTRLLLLPGPTGRLMDPTSKAIV